METTRIMTQARVNGTVYEPGIVINGQTVDSMTFVALDGSAGVLLHAAKQSDDDARGDLIAFIGFDGNEMHFGDTPQ